MQDEPTEADYWCRYYDKRDAPVLPSQFALFVANEVQTGALPSVATIIDVGCGNGRDAVFFLHLGLRVFGIDRSEMAVESCRELLGSHAVNIRARGDFVVAAADDAPSWRKLADATSGPVLVYARFFFHSIDEGAQSRVLAEVAKLLAERGGAFCAEFRTHKDSESTKTTPDHYRRFIDPDDFARRIEEASMRVVWRTDGRGMAKYRSDDAHVARFLALAR